MSKHTHRKPLPIAKLRVFLSTHRQDGGNLVLRTKLAKLLDALSNVYAWFGNKAEADTQAAFVVVVRELRGRADRLRAAKRGAYVESCRALLRWSVVLDCATARCRSERKGACAAILSRTSLGLSARQERTLH